MEEVNINTEEFLDWIVKMDLAFYVADPLPDYDPGCNSHFYIKGSPERFSSKELIQIYTNTASKETNENWLYALADIKKRKIY